MDPRERFLRCVELEADALVLPAIVGSHQKIVVALRKAGDAIVSEKVRHNLVKHFSAGSHERLAKPLERVCLEFGACARWGAWLTEVVLPDSLDLSVSERLQIGL